jgi:uncharacterized protein involved in exopolysaccharide biosynthesis
MNEAARTETHPRETYQDDAQLADYLIVAWRFRRMILLLTVAGAALGWVVSRTTPPSYEAAVVVSLVPRPADEPGATSAAAVTALVRSPALLTKVVGDLGFDRAPFNVSASRLAARDVTVETMPDTKMRVLVRLDQPERARKLANELARQAVAASVTTAMSQSVAARDRLRPEIQKAQTRLDNIEVELSKTGALNHVQDWRTDVDELTAEHAELRSIPLAIAAQKAKVAAMEEELKRQRSTLVQPLSNQSVANAIYEQLAVQLAVERSEVAGLLERQRQLAARTRASSAAPRTPALHAKEAEVNRVQAEQVAALKKYVDLREGYERAEELAGDATPQMQIVEPAQLGHPVSLGSLRLTLIGCVGGAFVSVFLALALNYFNALRVRVTA